MATQAPPSSNVREIVVCIFVGVPYLSRTETTVAVSYARGTSGVGELTMLCFYPTSSYSVYMIVNGVSKGSAKVDVVRERRQERAATM
jgi:hypothetical protein